MKSDSIENIEWDIRKIPEKFRADFIKETISVKIIDRKKIVEKDEYFPGEDFILWRVKINKGTGSGVKIGLYFMTEGDTFSINIDSVQNNSSFGTCDTYDINEKQIRIGTELRTKWEK